MFFKRIEMTGFKSFATKTLVEFMPGTTVIVGPNGCGKSNVLDSIRWVLGEQSAKSLRGGRMGDIIFNGSASLKALGYAQVSLTINNEQRLLPLDQSEIQITRRLFRTGESEYQLNKVNCRLKDITNLLLDTGIGTSAYSILEQGRVDQIINAKPPERRLIFEEAAGISKYKVRREEALRKLARTQDDLLRLHDIIAEVERSCNSLKRQAQKAARYKRLKERERDLEQRLLVRRAELLSGDYKKFKAIHREMEDKLQGLNARLAGLEAKSSEEQGRQQELQKTLQQGQSLHYALKADLEKSIHERDLARERMESARKRLDEIDRELASARDRATVLTATLEKLTEEANAQEETLRQKREELAALSRRYEEIRRSSDSASLRSGVLRGEISGLNQKKLQVENDERLAGHLIEKIQGEMETHASLMQDLARDVEDIGQKVESRRAAMQTVEQDLVSLTEQRRSLQAEIDLHKAERNDLQTRLDELTTRHHQVRSRLAALRELEEAFEGYYRGVKEVMVASQGNKLQGIVGVVSSLVGVKKEHEIAIEVALGGSVQDIVTVSVDDAKAAIEYLKRSNRGRATFLPLDFLEADVYDNSLRPLVKRPGVIGFARELVTYEPRIEIVVRHLFGTTLVVEHVDIAIDLKRQGHKTRFVTLDGEVVHPRGVMTGGSHQSRGLLSRVREIRQLEDEAKEVQTALEDIRAKLRATNDRLNVGVARTQELQQQTHEKELERGSVRKDLESLEGRLRERRNQLAQAEARSAQQRVERARHEDTIQKCKEGLVQITAAMETRQTELAQLESEIRQRQSEVEKVGQEVGEHRVDVTARGERLNALREKLQGLEFDLEQAREDQGLKAEERRELQEDIKVQTGRIEEAEGRIGELTGRVEVEERKCSLQNQEIETILVGLKRLDSEVHEAMRDRNEVDNEVREHQLRLTEIKAQLDYIERESQEKFALDVEHIRDEIKAREQADRADSAFSIGDEEEEDSPAAVAAKQIAAATPAPVAGEVAQEQGVEGEVANDGAAEATEAAEAGPRKPSLPKEYIDQDLTDPSVLRRLLGEVRDKISRLGNVNTTAIEEYEEKRKRFEYLTAQEKDLIEAKTSLETTIEQIDETCTKLFWDAFENIRQNFQDTFRRLFNGGRADLVLLEPQEGSDELEAGIDIVAQPPGKKLQSIMLMSGGEKAMTAVGLMFALFLHKPSPFCVLDEIDAPLDDANVGRFCDMLREFQKTTQFIVITHNKMTMSLADSIYGVTMQEPGVSKVVSVKFEEAAADRLLAGGVAG